MAIIVSYGGGTNSTAMLVGMVQFGIKPDAILFADTGAEHPQTYEYVKYFSKWLQSKQFPGITTVKYKTKDGVELTIEQDCINNQTIPAIAFGWKTCSQKFKIQPQDKWVKNYFPNEIELVKYIGFDAGEPNRAKPDPNGIYINQFPLIEWGWDRRRCIEVIIGAGLCLPGKSSCFICPNMDKHEVRALPANHKDRVKRLEKNATKLSTLKGLGRSYSWTDVINADESQLKIFDDLELYQTPCNCIG